MFKFSFKVHVLSIDLLPYLKNETTETTTMTEASALVCLILSMTLLHLIHKHFKIIHPNFIYFCFLQFQVNCN